VKICSYIYEDRTSLVPKQSGHFHHTYAYPCSIAHLLIPVDVLNSRDSVSILQDLVFVVRQDVDDLYFQLEHLDQHVEQIESLLATLLHSLHAPGMATDTLDTLEMILVPSIQTVVEEEIDMIELYIT
jgi:hypothetical protein